MMMRVPDIHVWPDATNAANATPLTAETTSASSKISIGAFWRCEQILQFDNRLCSADLSSQLSCEGRKVRSNNGSQRPASPGTSLDLR
jgi:hypothetical protein